KTHAAGPERLHEQALDGAPLHGGVEVREVEPVEVPEGVAAGRVERADGLLELPLRPAIDVVRLEIVTSLKPSARKSVCSASPAQTASRDASGARTPSSSRHRRTLLTNSVRTTKPMPLRSESFAPPRPGALCNPRVQHEAHGPIGAGFMSPRHSRRYLRDPSTASP